MKIIFCHEENSKIMVKKNIEKIEKKINENTIQLFYIMNEKTTGIII